ncbi:hypothetical protein [Halocynthiibacter namhaensis]|uniref:hypothetical protein n=1 Tax=Halocynthiibacter namhaensis TaxID=1290553 RepID=UPI000579530F|nr:hypothetical protein [Halocynthiibacter namhaensis]
MARPTLRSMRDIINAIALNKTGFANDQCYKLRILESDYAVTGNEVIASILNQQKAAKRSSTKRKASRQTSDHPRRKDYKSPEGFNQCGVATGRSYASRAGERMEAKQKGFPDVMRHPTTINNMVLPLDTADAKEMLDSCRPRMRDAFANLSDGVQISGGFQIAMVTAEYLATIFPADELPDCLDSINRPDEVFALLHWHGIIADPYLSKKEVRKIVRDAFPGSHRVCVAKVQPERINTHGELTHGAQGYLEYACLDKTEVKFKKPEQKISAIKGFALLGTQLSKRNRSFSMGKALAITGVEIDPARVIELEVHERLDYVKKNVKKLSYAEQFIHLWMSGSLSIIRKPQPWLQCSGSISDRFLAFLSIVKKWCADTSTENLCFYDYAEASLE